MKMQSKVGTLTRALVAVLLLPACSSSDAGGTPGTGGSNGSGGTTTAATGGTVGTGGSPAATGGTTGTGGVVGTGGVAPGTGGSAPGTGGGTGGTAGASTAGRGGGAQGGSTGTGGGSGGSDPGPVGGVPHVTPQSATSIPASFATAVPNGGKWTNKMYQAYYYNANGSVGDIFKPPVKQSTPVTKPVNIYTPPGYDPQMQYPYIVILHGYGNNESRWYQLANPPLLTVFDNLINSKATKPFIAVFPFGTIGSPSNDKGYYNFGGELMNDLIPFIEANYSVKKDRASRALAGFSFGGMQTILIGLCAHLKDFAWFGALHPAGGSFPASDIADHVAMENPQMNPVYYFYIEVGKSDTTAGGSAKSAADGLATKGPNITAANFSFQNNIGGSGPADGKHDYPTAEVGLFNFLQMAFAPN